MQASVSINVRAIWKSNDVWDKLTVQQDDAHVYHISLFWCLFFLYLLCCDLKCKCIVNNTMSYSGEVNNKKVLRGSEAGFRQSDEKNDFDLNLTV